MSYKSKIQAALLRYEELCILSEDDELFLHSHGQAAQRSSFLPGIKQRLPSFIFRMTWNEEPEQALRVQHLKKKFYFHFQDYVDLIIWKVPNIYTFKTSFIESQYYCGWIVKLGISAQTPDW
uniref:Uncharacterized protein n=1 Tax=Triticum urartu TaxID=4572 RepID=A0A8R7Q5K7_TRIUA